MYTERIQIVCDNDIFFFVVVRFIYMYVTGLILFLLGVWFWTFVSFTYRCLLTILCICIVRHPILLGPVVCNSYPPFVRLYKRILFQTSDVPV